MSIKDRLARLEGRSAAVDGVTFIATGVLRAEGESGPVVALVRGGSITREPGEAEDAFTARVLASSRGGQP